MVSDSTAITLLKMVKKKKMYMRKSIFSSSVNCASHHGMFLAWKLPNVTSKRDCSDVAVNANLEKWIWFDQNDPDWIFKSAVTFIKYWI